MTLDALVENPERIYSGNTYDLAVDYSDPLEPTVRVYRRDGQKIMMFLNQLPGLCWAFPRPLDSFLHDPSLVDLVAEDIVDYLNNELVYSFEEEPPDEPLLLFPLLLPLEQKIAHGEDAYFVDHHWNPYTQKKYCFFD